MRYVHGPQDDQPLAMELYPPFASPTPGTGSQNYYHADGEGSVRMLTGAGGEIVNRYDYDSFGRRLASVEGLPLQPYGWKGREWVPGPDIYYNRARFYDPALGRFLSEDPLGYGGGDSNLYSFAWNNPNWRDPSGLTAALEYGALAGSALLPAPAYRAVGCALSSLFFQLSLDVANYSNVRNDGNCGASGTPPQAPKPPPSDDGPSCGAPPPCGGMFSFEARTKILTREGLKNIEDVKVGDEIASRDAYTAATTWRPVTNLFRRTAPGVVRLTVEAEDGTRETYGVTAEHPFFKEGWGFTKVRELAVGDVLHAEGGARLKVLAIELTDHSTVVYNLEVAQDHSYFVGNLKARVHNQNYAPCKYYDEKAKGGSNYYSAAKDICRDKNALVAFFISNCNCGSPSVAQMDCIRKCLVREDEAFSQVPTCHDVNGYPNTACIHDYHDRI